MTKKYLLINKVDTIQKKLTGKRTRQGSLVPEEYKNYIPDIIEADGFLWIALDDMLQTFPMPLSWWFNDANLEMFKRLESEFGLFPIREFEVKMSKNK